MVWSADFSIVQFQAPPKDVVASLVTDSPKQLTWTEADLGSDGDLLWDLRSREGNEIGAGLYIFVLHARDANDRTIGTRTGKFVVIR